MASRQLGGLRTTKINTVIFEREAVRTLQKNAPVFDVLAMETLPRDSASPEDCSHVGTCKFW